MELKPVDNPNFETQISELATKAAQAEASDQAMKFAQAALNLAHAAQVMTVTQQGLTLAAL